MFKMFASIHKSPSEIQNSSLRDAALNIHGSTRIMEIHSEGHKEAIRIFQKTEEYKSFCEEWERRHASNVYSYFLGDDGTIVRTDTLEGMPFVSFAGE